MDLDEYLEQALSGAPKDSSGQFSVDYLKARDKLERFRLPSPSHYLLKAVQAAVLSGAAEVEVKVLGQATILRFAPRPDSPLSSFEAVERGLENPLEIKDASLRAICQAILGALLQADENVCWRMHDKAIWLGVSGTHLESGARPTDHCILTQFRPRDWRFWRRARQRANDLTTLDELARHCPIPVRLEKRNLQGGWRLSPRPARTMPYYFLYQCLWRCRGTEKHQMCIRRPASSSFFRQDDLFVYRPLVWEPAASHYPPSFTGDTCYYYEIVPEESSPGEVLRCRLTAAVESHLRPAEVTFVASGVSMQPIRLPTLNCPGLRLLAPGDGLDLDASGFQVVQNSRFQDRLGEFEKAVKQVRGRLKSCWKRCSTPVYDGGDMSADARFADFHRKLKAAYGEG